MNFKQIFMIKKCKLNLGNREQTLHSWMGSYRIYTIAVSNLKIWKLAYKIQLYFLHKKKLKGKQHIENPLSLKLNTAHLSLMDFFSSVNIKVMDSEILLSILRVFTLLLIRELTWKRFSQTVCPNISPKCQHQKQMYFSCLLQGGIIVGSCLQRKISGLNIESCHFNKLWFYFAFSPI